MQQSLASISHVKPSNNMRAKVDLVIIEAIENLAFIEVTAVSKFTPYVDDLERLRAEILINDPFPGELRLIMAKELVSKIAQNAYVIDESEVTDQVLTDLLGETINVIAGRLMTELIPENLMFRLGLPQIGKESFLDLHAGSIAFEFKMEDLPFWLILFGDGFLALNQE